MQMIISTVCKSYKHTKCVRICHHFAYKHEFQLKNNGFLHNVLKWDVMYIMAQMLHIIRLICKYIQLTLD